MIPTVACSSVHKPSKKPHVPRMPFPRMLYEMLKVVEKNEQTDIVSWQPHGRCFLVHKHKKFIKDIMPKLFRQTKYSSFQRQLNLYGFQRLSTGPDKGGYYHECFLRGSPLLLDSITRTRVKGTGVQKPIVTKLEPNFYAMAPLDTRVNSFDHQWYLPSKYVNTDQESKSLLVTPIMEQPNLKSICSSTDFELVNQSKVALHVPSLEVPQNKESEITQSSDFEVLSNLGLWDPIPLGDNSCGFSDDSMLSDDLAELFELDSFLEPNATVLVAE